MLFLDVARQMMLNPDWSHRAATVVLESHTGPGRFVFYGANHPDTIDEVHARRVDISTLNPAAMLTMAHRGVGAFSSPREVATIAVLPHDDRLGFAVARRLGFTSLADIAAARYPLRVSVRGSIDACTPIMVDVVLRAHGFSLADLQAWGGQISYDQPMPNHRSRMGRLAAGELDAIFDEGVVMWADQVAGAGADLLALSAEHLETLQAEGFRPALHREGPLPLARAGRARRRLQRLAHLLPLRHRRRPGRAVLPVPGRPARHHPVGYRRRPPAAAAPGAHGHRLPPHAHRRAPAPPRRRRLARARLPELTYPEPG